MGTQGARAGVEMATTAELIRKATTLALAVLLWAHALLFVDFQVPVFRAATRLLRVTTSEAILFALLLSFSFLAASGFWRTVRSLAYIYLFPFVLLWYLLRLCFHFVRGTHRRLVAHAPPAGGAPLAARGEVTTPPAPPEGAEGAPQARRNAEGLWLFLARPFRRFTILWCILLLFSTHPVVVWLSLFVVLVHVARWSRFLLKILLFSDSWLRDVGARFMANLDRQLAALAQVTIESPPTTELKNLWNQITSLKRILGLLGDPYILSRWGWVLGIAFLGLIYVYMAFLFSFGYYGIARVGGADFPWPNALVTSLFIPFFVPDLPKMLAIEALGGIHCSLVVLVSVGTVVNFLRRKLDAMCAASADLSVRLSGRNVQEKILILDGKFSAQPALSQGNDRARGPGGTGELRPDESEGAAKGNEGSD